MAKSKENKIASLKFSKESTSASFLIFMNASFVLEMSQFESYQSAAYLSTVLAIIGLAFLIIHIFLYSIFNIQWILLTFATISIGMTSYYISGSASIVKLILFFYAVKDIDISNALKYFTISLVIPLTVIVACSIFGVVDLSYSGNKSAYSFGMQNPNTVPVIIFAIIVGINLRPDFEICIKNLAIEILVSVLVFYLCGARTAGVVLAIYLLLLLFVKYIKKASIIRIIFWPLQFLFPICTVFSLYLIESFRSYSAFWINVNQISSGRLIAWSKYIDFYGVTLFGNDVQFNVGSLDSAYMQLLIKYGIIAYGLYLAMFIAISIFAYNHKRMILLVSIISTELYCISEFGPLLINFCPVLIYLACLLWNDKSNFQSFPLRN